VARPKRKKPSEADESVVPIDVYLDQERIELIQELADQLALRPSWAADLEARLDTLEVKITKDQKRASRRVEELMEPLADEARRLREETSERLALLKEGVSALKESMEAGRTATSAARRAADEDRARLAALTESLESERVNLQQALGEAGRERSELRALVESLAERQDEQRLLQKTTGSELLELARRLARPWYRRLLG